MSRTRIVFFGVLAIFLALIAGGLGVEVVNPRFVQQLFIAATVFAGGVVLLDMFGLLGHHSDAGQDVGSAVGDSGDIGPGGAFDHGGLDHVAVEGADGGGGHDGGGQGDHAHDGDHSHEASDHAQHGQAAAAPIISALTYLRLLVYFCLGFGPVGWVAMSSGRSALLSVLLAAPVGIGAVFLAQAFFRFQRKDTDSRVKPDELIARDATVIVPLDATNMGRVRVKVGMNVEDLFALAADRDRRYEKGEPVRITRVTDECVYVR
jgi:membrane protein implicated in regulation of membrane protease activity